MTRRKSLTPHANGGTDSPLSRRALLRGAVAASTFSIVPRHVLGGGAGPAPSDRPALAGVGVGGVGFGQLQGCEQAGFSIVALCDVDDDYARKAYDQWPEARRYRDFREMIAAEGDRIDAVYCGTPDHTHAIITLAALRAGKHVCCVKPLTRTVEECRIVVQAARSAGVATQVTSAPNTSEAACRTCELIWAGAIGPVRELHVWSDRPYWPQGMARPDWVDPIPKSLDWDLWIGPAPQRPFASVWPEGHLALTQVVAGNSPRGVYHPWNFRGWWDFGTGALGDMGCHHLNTPYRALKLGYPSAVQASSTKVTAEVAPLASIVTYDYPAREDMPAVRVVWYDGGLRPPLPEGLGGKPLPGSGELYVGDEGMMLESRILDPARARQFADVPRTLPRRSGTWGEWFEACQGGEPAGCDFAWNGPITEFVLLGNIALRTGRRIEYDGDAGQILNLPEADGLLRADYQNGWTLEA